MFVCCPYAHHKYLKLSESLQPSVIHLVSTVMYRTFTCRSIIHDVQLLVGHRGKANSVKKAEMTSSDAKVTLYTAGTPNGKSSCGDVVMLAQPLAGGLNMVFAAPC